MKPKDTHPAYDQHITVQKRLSQRRSELTQFRTEKTHYDNQTNHLSNLQQALFKAAKVGNINLMLEFINKGADPFIKDGDNRNAISYAIVSDPIKVGSLITELAKAIEEDKKGGSDEQ